MDQQIDFEPENQTINIWKGSAVVRLDNATRLCNLASLLPLTSAEIDSDTGNEVRKLIDSRVFNEAAAYLALKHFNERNDRLLPLQERLQDCDVRLSVEFRDTRFSPIHAARQLQDIRRGNPFALLGAARSQVTQTLSILTGVYQLPQMSATSTSALLDNKDTSPYFARTVPTNYGDAKATVLYLQHFGITHFGILFIQDDFGNFFHAALLKEAAAFDMRVVSSAYTDRDSDDTDADSSSSSSLQGAIQQLQQAQIRYIVGIFNPNSWKTVVREASRAGIMGQPGYTWILTEASLELTQPGFHLHQDDTDVARAIHGVGVVLLDVPINLPFEEALSEFQTNATLQQEFVEQHVERDVFETFEFVYPGGSLYQQLNYDAVMALGVAACDAPQEFFTGPELYETLVNLEFQGVSGSVSFHPATGTRDVEDLRYTVTNVLLSTGQEPTNGTLHFRANVSAVVDLQSSGSPIQVLNPFIYSDNTTNRPPPLPPREENMNLISPAIRGVGLGLGGLAMLCSLGWLLWTIHYRNRDVVRIAQPEFLCMLCVGAFIFASSVIPMSLQEPFNERGLDIACMTTPWLLSLGFVTAFSALFSKTWRLNKLFNHGERFRRVKVTATDVIYPFVVLFTLNVTILTVWTIVDPLQWKRVEVSNFDSFGRSIESYGTCYGENGFLDSTAQYVLVSLLVIVNVVALLFANYQSYLARNLPTDFNESFYVGISMAGLLEALLLACPILVLVRDNPSADFIIRSILVTIICLMILLPIFVPKYVQRSVSRSRNSTRPRRGSLPRGSLQRGSTTHSRGSRASALSVEAGDAESTNVGKSVVRRTEDYYAQRSSARNSGSGAARRSSILVS